MIRIQKATPNDTVTLAHLAKTTWEESHGHYIADKNDLTTYLDKNFSVSRTEADLNNPKIHFYIIYVNDIPAGYAKLNVDEINEHVDSKRTSRLERIFIQNEFIPLKLGKQLLTFVEKKAKVLQVDSIWLTVYIKNKRAIRFYEKNEFIDVGHLNFIVNGKAYDNIVFSKAI